MVVFLAGSAGTAEGQPAAVAPQYRGWQHSGSVYILTTPEGADLPASTSEEGFPLLVRLHKDFFDFSQAKANGEDIRLSTTDGTPLSYEIEEWDASKGTASVWVRLPRIRGNARQEIKLHWGKADAASESSGAAVFNESNGYLSVWHMSGPVKDEVGTPGVQGCGHDGDRRDGRPGAPLCRRTGDFLRGQDYQLSLGSRARTVRKRGSGRRSRTLESWPGATSRRRAKW